MQPAATEIGGLAIGEPHGPGPPAGPVARLQHEKREAAGGEPFRRRQSRRAGADDDDVEFVMGQIALLCLAAFLAGTRGEAKLAAFSPFSPLWSARPCGELGMTERVRLLIWDLDDTFWRGALTEGGIAFIEAHKEIVVELARRGIVSSICSKNAFETVKAALVAHDVWDYFVLPSVTWDAKGPRIRDLVETIGLARADRHVHRRQPDQP